MKNKNTIFKRGSKTFYTASIFFPSTIRRDVTRLYAFVRSADDLVDQKPQDKKGFMLFKKQTQQALKSTVTSNDVINDFVLLCQEYSIEKKWVYAFLDAMEQDLVKKKYSTYRELEKYMYGSAEVIGLMMARILRLPKKAENAARLQGKAMQLINFIRDIKEDMDLGRQYVPQKDIEQFGIQTLSPKVNNAAFKSLIDFEVRRYEELQQEAAKGYSCIPRASRIPIATAASIYGWTAKRIQQNPMIVFEQQIKPSKLRIVGEYVKQFFML